MEFPNTLFLDVEINLKEKCEWLIYWKFYEFPLCISLINHLKKVTLNYEYQIDSEFSNENFQNITEKCFGFNIKTVSA